MKTAHLQICAFVKETYKTSRDSEIQTLNDFLHELNISKSELARRLGASPSYITMILSSERPVTASFRWRFASVYGIDAAQSVLPDGDEVRASNPEPVSNEGQK